MRPNVKLTGRGPRKLKIGIKGAVVEFFSAIDYLGSDPEISPEPIASNSARE